MQRLTMILMAALTCTAGAATADEPPAAHEYELDNGLQLIVKEDHRSPVVVSQIWYKVGSSYEHNGITGVSHVLEHMMFKGTEKHTAGEFSRIISENGGRENAFTGRDYTAYFQQLASDRLGISFELEADRMRNLLLPEEEFKKEINVVKEERRLRTEDDPQSLTYEQFNATAFVSSPYHHPVIGWMDDLEHLRIEDLERWYRMWYAPNNATLVVVGDVDPAAVHRLARKHFGPLKPSDPPELKPRSEKPQHGLRRATVRAPAEVPYLVMGYKTPVLRTAENDWEPYALEVLAGILDGGNSARLARHVVRGDQIAAQAGAGYDLYSRHESVLMLDGTPAQGHDLSELEAALRAQIERLREELVTPGELARIKTQVVASNVYERDSIFYKAMQIGILETVGLDRKLIEEYVERVRAVTAEQVRDVARKYLTEERLTISQLEPLPIDNPAAPAAGGGHHGH